MENYLKTHVKWQQQKISPLLKWMLIVHLPLLFLIFFILTPGWLAKQQFNLAMGLSEPLNFILGIPLVAFGLVMYLWTIILFARARGTQVPVVPTQELVTTGPYAITRNPMMTSGCFMVMGIGLVLSSWSFILVGQIPFFIYLVYIRLFEEKELENRFGEAYKTYKKATPFVIPGIPC